MPWLDVPGDAVPETLIMIDRPASSKEADPAAPFQDDRDYCSTERRLGIGVAGLVGLVFPRCAHQSSSRSKLADAARDGLGGQGFCQHLDDVLFAQCSNLGAGEAQTAEDCVGVFSQF